MELFLPRRIVCRFCILSLLFWLLPSGLLIQGAHAAQLGAVQSGATTIADGSSMATATLTPVDPTKAFLVFGTSFDEAGADDGQITGQITNCTTTCNEVTFQRADTDTAVEVHWYVAEFVSGVFVQRGSVAMDATTKNVTLSSVNTGTSFPLISLRHDDGEYDDEDFVRAQVTSSTNLQLTVVDSDATTIVEWQVVEYTDAIVQTGEVTFGNNDSVQTATIASVDTATSWLIYSYEVEAGAPTSITTSSPLTAVNDDLYLAAISMKENEAVSSVTGLGLTWTLVQAQCSAREKTRTEVWKAQGTPTGDGLVTATLAAPVDGMAIAVSRYSGVDAVTPIGNVDSANTNGVGDTTCTLGTDTNSYSFSTLDTSQANSVVFVQLANAIAATRRAVAIPKGLISEAAPIKRRLGSPRRSNSLPRPPPI